MKTWAFYMKRVIKFFHAFRKKQCKKVMLSSWGRLQRRREYKITFSLVYQHYFLTWRVGNSIECMLFFERTWQRTSRPESENSYFRYKCEKVILSSCGRLKRPREDKITFSLVYRTLFFDTTCGKLNFEHAFLFERARKQTSRTECAKIYIDASYGEKHCSRS